jgi:hypothetical protein
VGAKIRAGDVLEDWSRGRPRLVQLNRQFRVRLRIFALTLANRFWRGKVTSQGGPVVSLTTYGDRIHKVYITIESIAQGSHRPSRLILWLDDPDQFNNPPRSLSRLVARGLELRTCSNFGPHKKYYPYVVENNSHQIPLVTADDDILYPKWWLDGLNAAFEAASKQIHAYRAHRVVLTDGQIAPYSSWPRSAGPASILNFSTGVSGAIFPPEFLDTLRDQGEGFTAVCPRADDVWLHATAVRSGVLIHQVMKDSVHFNVVPGTQGQALMHGNVTSGANDLQIAATYTDDDLLRLVTADAIS